MEVNEQEEVEDEYQKAIAAEAAEEEEQSGGEEETNKIFPFVTFDSVEAISHLNYSQVVETVGTEK